MIYNCRMVLLCVLIAAEIIFGLAVTNPHLVLKETKSVYNATILAQDATPAPTDTTAPPPADTSVPPDTSAPAETTPEAAPETQPPETPPSETTPAPEEALPTEITPEVPAETPPAETPPATEEQAAAPSIEFTSQESQAISDAGSLTNVDNIAPTEINKAQSEDAQLAQATTPEENASLLIDQVGNKTEDVSNLTENSDFTTTTFVTQRVDNQIDQALTEIGGLSPEAGAPLREKLVQLSETAEPIFRSEQLVVPDNLEQDLEIIRGKLLNIQLQRSQ